MAVIYDKNGEYKQNYIESKMRKRPTNDDNNEGDDEEADAKLETGPNDQTSEQNKPE